MFGRFFSDYKNPEAEVEAAKEKIVRLDNVEAAKAYSAFIWASLESDVTYIPLVPTSDPRALENKQVTAIEPKPALVSSFAPATAVPA